MSEEKSIMTAKVVVLEILVRALFRHTFLTAEDPIAAFDEYAARLNKNLEGEILKDGVKEGEVAWIMISEHLNGFFDQLRHELKLAQDRGQQELP
jgi:hypothetical protein